MVKLPKNKKMSINDLKRCETKYVYFEIKKDYDIKVKKGDKVLINTILQSSENNCDISSSVSGKIVECDKYIKIENDFKYNEKKVDVKKIDKNKFIKLLKDGGIKGMGGAGFPTYKKYSADKIDLLIINAIECEPYITADYMVSKLHSEEIVATIKTIMKINNIEKCIIGVKENNYNISSFFKEEENIKVVKVKDFYPAGWERSLIRQTTKLEYNNIPIEKNIIVNNISTIYAIGNLLNGHYLSSRIVTITGNINNPGNYLINIGTKAEDILKQLNIKSDNVIIGGPMMGHKLNNDIILPETNCILVLNDLKDEVNPCLRCGKCIKVCPVKIEPVLIKDNINNIEVLKKIKPTKCIECGLCSYICPSKIQLRDSVIDAKEKVRR